MDNYFYTIVLRLLLPKLTTSLPAYTTTALKNALILVQASLLARTVCLNKSKAFVGQCTGRHATAAASNYKRLVRFFDAHAATDLWIDLVAWAIRLLRLRSDYLLLDGTSWRGPDGRYVHLLTLCVSYRGVAIPIAWVDIEKKGTSSLADRKALLELASRHYDLRGRTLLADREYIGAEWFKLLTDRGLGFCIRSRHYAYFPDIEKYLRRERLTAAIAAVKRGRKPNKARRFRFRLEPGGPWLSFVVARNPDEEAASRVMYLITTEVEDAYRTVATYLKRWAIEQCFRQLKSNGFDLEAVNLRTGARRRLLIAVAVVAYVVAVIEGLWTYAKAVPVKSHGSDARRYPAVSAFRYGIDAIGAHLTDLRTFCRYLTRAFERPMTGYRSSTLSLNV